MVLKNEELINTSGGAIKYGVYGLIGAAITFILGMIDGYLRPLACNR